ncbi:bile acid:sodium symporter family protein [Knoellia subterranea]|uniref:Bile acid:sodium symporter n=1 Tax=Knoellia subterranea KCTC 19937 TaxID=1385521 RepID=A0A0A0JPL7_9MICO|nr:bile acid:sodium symporter family protein [Knoellia subterranea]KGN38714.1 bile acid:sodium symporter [Knoellia subterranea KCTC 19937]
MDSALLTIGLPVPLAIIMFGLGLSLTPDDFRRVRQSPRAVVIALVCQLLVLPLVAFGLVELFGLPPLLAVGFMILAASPGGTTANLYSHLFRGDVALNITLTAINSVIAIVTLPLITGWAIGHFVDESSDIGLQFDKLLQVFAIVLIPVLIGMFVRRRSPEFADRMDRPVRTASAVLLLLVVIGAMWTEKENITTYLAEVGLIATLFCILSLSVGYFVPRRLGLTEDQAVASGFEIGIHNSTLAIAMALTVIGNAQMSVPSAVYGVLMFPIAAAFGLIVRNRGVLGTPEAGAPASPSRRR